MSTVDRHPALLVLGEALMDCMAQPDGTLRPLLGGSPYNLACAAALQGANVGWVTPFSSDVFGQSLRQHLAATGARALLASSALPTSLAVVHVENGQPSYGFYREAVADRNYAAADVMRLLEAQPPGVLHTGSLMAVPPENGKVMQVARRARELGWTLSVDLNLRPRLAADLQAYLQAVRELAPLADWLKASDEDLALLGFGEVQLAQAPELARHWLGQGCQRVALTFGAHGAFLQVGAAQASLPAPRVAVVDTVGAGDTFWGSCLADWIISGSRQAPAVAEQRIHSTLQRAVKAAAINCTRAGCQPPTLAELDAA